MGGLFQPRCLKLNDSKKKPLGSGKTVGFIIRQSFSLVLKIFIQQAKRKFRNFCSPLARRWARCEWFYPDVDQSYFAQNEFVECLGEIGVSPRVNLGCVR